MTLLSARRLLFWATDVELTNSWGKAHGKVIGHYILVSLFPVHITHTNSRLALQRDRTQDLRADFIFSSQQNKSRLGDQITATRLVQCDYASPGYF